MSIPIEAIHRFARNAEAEAIAALDAASTIGNYAAIARFALREIEEFDRATRALACAAEGIRRALKDAQSEARSD